MYIKADNGQWYHIIDWFTYYVNYHNESIYKCDWTDSDFAMGCTYRGRLRLYCPCCENKLVDEGKEWN